jgi:hypothetical protein
VEVDFKNGYLGTGLVAFNGLDPKKEKLIDIGF